MKELSLNEDELAVVLDALSSKIEMLTETVRDCTTAVKPLFERELNIAQELYNRLTA